MSSTNSSQQPSFHAHNPLIPQTQFFLNLFSKRDSHVRKKAAQILGRLGDKSCLTRLSEQLEQEREPNVQKAIQQAIAKLES